MRRFLALLLIASTAGAQTYYNKSTVPPNNTLQYTLVADSTGTNDAGAAITTQLVAATTAKACLIVPPGTYKITTPITAPAGASCIKGSNAPASKLLLSTTNAATAGQIFTISGAAASAVTGFWVEGLVIDGNSTNLPTDSYTMLSIKTSTSGTSYCSNVVFYRNTFQNIAKQVANVTGCNYTGFRENLFTNTGTGASFQTSTVVDISFSTNADNATYAVGNFAEGNVFSAYSGDGIDFAGQKGFVAHRNTFITTIASQYVDSTTSLGSGAIYSAGAIYTPANVDSIITDNYITGQSGNGIDLSGGHGYTLAGNVVVGSGHSGLSIAGNMTYAANISDVSVGSNVFKNNNQAITFITATVAETSITGGALTTLNMSGSVACTNGNFVSGTGITLGTTITAGCGTATLTLSQAGTSTPAAILNFSSKYPAANGGASTNGIFLTASGVGSAITVSNISIGPVVAIDDQGSPTQVWGVGTGTAATTILSNINISPTAVFSGNTSGSIQTLNQNNWGSTGGPLLNLPSVVLNDLTGTSGAMSAYSFGVPTFTAANSDTASVQTVYIPAPLTSSAGGFAPSGNKYSLNLGGGLFATGTSIVNNSSSYNFSLGTGTNTGTTTIGNTAGTGSSITLAAPITVGLGTSLSQATWGTAGIGIIASAATFNDTTTGSGGVTTDTAYAVASQTFTNAQGTANVLTNAETLRVAAPICGSGWASCTNLYSIRSVGILRADAAISGGGGATINGAAVTLNGSSNFATSINTGTSNGAIHIGDGSGNNTITIGNGTGVITEQGPWTASNATVKLSGIASSSAAQTGTVCLGTAGLLTYDTTTTCLLSSIRWKEHVEPLDAGLSEITRLKPVSYDLKPEFNPANLGRQVGLIAEDVQKIDPRLVGVGKDGLPNGVRYQQLTALLVKGIQELEAENAKLRARVEKLEAK